MTNKTVTVEIPMTEIADRYLGIQSQNRVTEFPFELDGDRNPKIGFAVYRILRVRMVGHDEIEFEQIINGRPDRHRSVIPVMALFSWLADLVKAAQREDKQ